jgi:hypothetical protein
MILSNKKTKNKKLIILTLTAISLLILCLFLTKSFPFEKPENQASQEQDQRNAGQQIKESSLDSQKDKTGISGSDQPPTPAPSPNGGKSTIEINITAANQNDSLLQIRSLILAVDSGGICSLSLTRSGFSPITKTAPAQALSSSSTCQGFDIPLSELAPGEWSVILNYESSSLVGSTTRSITIK